MEQRMEYKDNSESQLVAYIIDLASRYFSEHDTTGAHLLLRYVQL